VLIIHRYSGGGDDDVGGLVLVAATGSDCCVKIAAAALGWLNYGALWICTRLQRATVTSSSQQPAWPVTVLA